MLSASSLQYLSSGLVPDGMEVHKTLIPTQIFIPNSFYFNKFILKLIPGVVSGLEVLKAQADFGDALLFPRVPCHSQGVERTVQLVTKACKKVRSHTRRHQEILSKLYWRKLTAQGLFVPRGQKSPRTPITPRSPRPKRSRK